MIKRKIRSNKRTLSVTATWGGVINFEGIKSPCNDRYLEEVKESLNCSCGGDLWYLDIEGKQHKPTNIAEYVKATEVIKIMEMAKEEARQMVITRRVIMPTQAEKQEDKDGPAPETQAILDRLAQYEQTGEVTGRAPEELRKLLGVSQEEVQSFTVLKEAVETVTVEAGPKATKKDLRAALGAASHSIMMLLADIEVVRKVAAHYRGLAGSEDMSAGYIMQLECRLRDQEMSDARAEVQRTLGLSELETVNLSNSPSIMTNQVLTRFRVALDKMGAAARLVNLAAKVIEDGDYGVEDPLELLRVVVFLLTDTARRAGGAPIIRQ